MAKGAFSRAHLVTLRRGELARDQIKGALVPLAQEIVKLKGLADSFACLFYRPPGPDGPAACSRHADRPLECRLLFCQAPDALAAAYDQDRLTRRDLLPDSPGLDRLLAAHDDRCDHARLRDLLARPDAEAQAAVHAMLAYDAQLRAMAVSRLNVPEDELDFLLGRPLTAFLLPADLESQGEKTYLASDPPQGERP